MNKRDLTDSERDVVAALTFAMKRNAVHTVTHSGYCATLFGEIACSPNSQPE